LHESTYIYLFAARMGRGKQAADARKEEVFKLIWWMLHFADK